MSEDFESGFGYSEEDSAWEDFGYQSSAINDYDVDRYIGRRASMNDEMLAMYA